MKHSLLYILNIFSFILIANAQPSFPKNYFQNPMGIPMDLAANFGEIRKNHYHMGLDIRTQQRENLPVYAAQRGYVSRISIQTGGFGRAIYITHPEGYVTVYAHLNKFYTPLENYLQEQQYNTKQWAQDISLSPNQFPVAKGQLIALSGNTGASEGPHLHFEIRNSVTENCLNPLLFGFMNDNIMPSLSNVYWYDRTQSTYESKPNAIAFQQTNAIEKVNSRYVSFAIKIKDRINPTSFSLGIYDAKVFVDGNLLARFKIDSVSYNDTRYSNAAIDYPEYISGRGAIQHLSRLPGNRLNIVTGNNDGILYLNDNAAHDIIIETKDLAGNTVTAKFAIQYDPAQKENLPAVNKSITKLKPNSTGEIANDNTRIAFSNRALYDTVTFALYSTSAAFPYVSAVTTIYPGNVPVHDNFTASLRLSNLAYNKYKDQIVVLRKGPKNENIAKATTTDNVWYSASFREPGTLALVADTITPVITTAGWANGAIFGSNSNIRIHCTDNLKQINNFSATLENGQWLLFAPSGNVYAYTMDKYCPPGVHTLTVRAEDVAGNIKVATFTFTVKEGAVTTTKKQPAQKRGKKK